MPYIHIPFCPTAAFPMAKWEENNCCTHCSRATTHNAIRILAPFPPCWGYFLSFSFACLTQAQHKKGYKGCRLDWSLEQSPSFLFCETANTSSNDLHKNKAPPSVVQSELLKISSYFLSSCSLLSQAASSCLSQTSTYASVSFEQNRFSCLRAYIHEM